MVCSTFDTTFYYEDGSTFNCFMRYRIIPRPEDWHFRRNTRLSFGEPFPDADYIGVKWVLPNKKDYDEIDRINSNRPVDANVLIKNERGEIVALY